MAKQYTLGKNERLKSRKLIQQLFSKGKSFSIFPFKVYYLITGDEDRSKQDRPPTRFNVQFGIGVSGKIFKKAFERNRIKRLAREAFRLQKEELKNAMARKSLQLYVFMIYTGKELPDFAITKEKVGVILKKLVKIINESSSPGP